MYYYPMMNGFDSAWGFGMSLFWTALFILGIVFLVRFLREHGGDSRHHRGSDPLQIAKERYAKGEIKREEYEQLKKDLSQ